MGLNIYRFDMDDDCFELQVHHHERSAKLVSSQPNVFWVTYSSGSTVFVDSDGIEVLPAFVFGFFRPNERNEIAIEQAQSTLDCIEMPYSFFSDDIVVRLLEKHQFNGFSVRQMMAMSRGKVDIFIPFVRSLLPIALMDLPVVSLTNHQKAFARIKDVIERNHSNPELYLEQVAMLCFYSKRKVQAVLAKELLTFSELTNQIRVESFCQMLIETSLLVENISYKCGFNSLNYGARQFKRLVGMTPKQYRMEFYDEVYCSLSL